MIMKTVVLALAAGSVLLAQDAPNMVVEQRIKVKAGAVGASTMEFVAGELMGGSPVKDAPYSAQTVTQTTQTLADGNRIARNSTSMIYRDSEGRERRELSLGNLGNSGEPVQSIFISDPVAGANYTLDTQTRTAMKMPAPPPLAKAKLKTPPGDVTFASPMLGLSGGMVPSVAGGPQVMIFRGNGAPDGNDQPAPKVEQLGTMNIEGLVADGTRSTVTIPAGQMGNEQPIQIVSERWYSPELKVTVLSKHSDPRMGNTEYRVTNLSRAEPLPSLFQVPPDYTLKDSPTFLYRTEKKQDDQ
jgi:hypothetical protein